jgi:voltage-gated potassium channel
MLNLSVKHMSGIRQKIHEIIFEADTPIGKAFDIALLIAILASVLVVMLESVKEIEREYTYGLKVAEWIF